MITFTQTDDGFVRDGEMTSKFSRFEWQRPDGG
jgi:hypothetical protein